jgi:hypothetical protein
MARGFNLRSTNARIRTSSYRSLLRLILEHVRGPVAVTWAGVASLFPRYLIDDVERQCEEDTDLEEKFRILFHTLRTMPVQRLTSAWRSVPQPILAHDDFVTMSTTQVGGFTETGLRRGALRALGVLLQESEQAAEDEMRVLRDLSYAFSLFHHERGGFSDGGLGDSRWCLGVDCTRTIAPSADPGCTLCRRCNEQEQMEEEEEEQESDHEGLVLAAVAVATAAAAAAAAAIQEEQEEEEQGEQEEQEQEEQQEGGEQETVRYRL